MNWLIDLSRAPLQRKNAAWENGICLRLSPPESVATLPPFSPIEGQKWFDQISSQWESQKNRFALIYFGKIQFLPPCIWNLPFMSTASGNELNMLTINYKTVTDATLTPNPDYKWTGGPGRSSKITTFSW